MQGSHRTTEDIARPKQYEMIRKWEAIFSKRATRRRVKLDVFTSVVESKGNAWHIYIRG
jgi:hypothetical protein